MTTTDKIRLPLRLLPCAFFVQGFSTNQSALEPRSTDADLVLALWWSMLGVGVLVLAIVMALLLTGSLRNRDGRSGRGLTPKQGWTMVIAGGVILPVAAVLGLVISSLSIGRDIAARAVTTADLTVEVVGRQWWWEIAYLDQNGDRIAVSANELHIPVDRDVRLLLKSHDVIHSFWVPNLQGKTDLIPGRTNTTQIRAREVGEYRGQCAEFCGVQHAFMGLLVIAEPADAFAAWLKRQASPATEPANTAGFDAFMAAGCSGCHTIRGTAARGVIGPDLTHIASRRTLAAATIPNTRGHLAGWIADPQHIKPGNKMPAQTIPPKSLRALVAYLEGLK